MIQIIMIKIIIILIIKTTYKKMSPPEFARDKRRVVQWNSFLARIGVELIALTYVMETITILLQPIYECLVKEDDFSLKWDHITFKWVS